MLKSRFFADSAMKTFFFWSSPKKSSARAELYADPAMKIFFLVFTLECEGSKFLRPPPQFFSRQSRYSGAELRSVFIGIRNCVAIMHFILTMRTENSKFFTCIYVRNYIANLIATRLNDICEILPNIEVKDFLLNCIKQHTTNIKY